MGIDISAPARDYFRHLLQTQGGDAIGIRMAAVNGRQLQCFACASCHLRRCAGVARSGAAGRMHEAVARLASAA